MTYSEEVPSVKVKWNEVVGETLRTTKVIGKERGLKVPTSELVIASCARQVNVNVPSREVVFLNPLNFDEHFGRILFSPQLALSQRLDQSASFPLRLFVQTSCFRFCRGQDPFEVVLGCAD